MTKTLSNEEILDAIAGKSVLDLADLVKSIEEKFGVKAAPVGMPVAGLTAAAGAPAEAPAEEKTDFTVTLTSIGEKKIQVIKAVREITSLGLKEAKELVESAPKPLKEGVPKAQAEEWKKKLVEVGASVELS